MKKENYRSYLRKGLLTDKYIIELKSILEKHLTIKKIPCDLVKDSAITKNLTRLPLFIATGNKSWQGLVVGFPGNTRDMTTFNVGTPYLRVILHPILQLFQAVNNKYLDNNAKCIYLLGVRFPDVFIRKFKLLSLVTPHIIVLTNDLTKTIRDKPPNETDVHKKTLESLYQQKICQAMDSKNGLTVPTAEGQINIGYISHEVQTAEGTYDPERLDILGYDINDHSLVAFEIKGPSCGRTQFENLFLQGLEHRNWIEENKMAIKLIKEGPKGKKIGTKKRVRLILGFCNERVHPLFHILKNTLEQKDKYTRIDFVNIKLNNDKIELIKTN